MPVLAGRVVHGMVMRAEEETTVKGFGWGRDAGL